MYAQVLVFLPVKTRTSPFLDYSIPEALKETVKPGVLVVVPVRNRSLPGIVIACTDKLSAPYVLPIQSVLDPKPALRGALLELARWIARETLSPLHKCVQMMLPPGLRPQAYQLVTPQVNAVPPGLPAPAETLLRYLIKRGPLKNSQLKSALKTIDLPRARRYLQGRGYISVERLLRMPRINPRTVRLVELRAPRENWETGLTRLRRLDLYTAVLEFLEREGKPVELDVVYAETDAQLNHINTLEKRGLIAFSRKEITRDPLADSVFTPDTPPVLTPGQALVWEGVKPMLAPGAGSAESGAAFRGDRFREN